MALSYLLTRLGLIINIYAHLVVPPASIDFLPRLHYVLNNRSLAYSKIQIGYLTLDCFHPPCTSLFYQYSRKLLWKISYIQVITQIQLYLIEEQENINIEKQKISDLVLYIYIDKHQVGPVSINFSGHVAFVMNYRLSAN